MIAAAVLQMTDKRECRSGCQIYALCINRMRNVEANFEFLCDKLGQSSFATAGLYERHRIKACVLFICWVIPSAYLSVCLCPCHI